LKLLVQKLDSGADISKLAVTTFTVYLAINGVLLKFATDAAAKTPPDRKAVLAFCVAGVGASLVYLLACYFKRRLRQATNDDIAALTAVLAVPLVSDQMLMLKYIGIATTVFTCLALSGWMYLLLFL
jgi:hypothetical protein